MQTGLRRLPEKVVARWKINPIWFAMMSGSHPRWSVSDARLVSVCAKGFLNGSKTSEGKSLSEELRSVRPGDVVKISRLMLVALYNLCV